MAIPSPAGQPGCGENHCFSAYPEAFHPGGVRTEAGKLVEDRRFSKGNSERAHGGPSQKHGVRLDIQCAWAPTAGEVRGWGWWER